MCYRRSRLPSAAASVLLVALFVAAPRASGPLAGPELGVTDLLDRAELAVLGDCIEVRSEWNASRTVIWTYATYEVLDTVKGVVPGGRLTLKELGGTVESITQAVVGGPRFATGQRDLLFLVAADLPGMYRTYALDRGQLPVQVDRHTGRQAVMAALPRSEATTGGPREVSPPQPVDLEGLLKTLARHLSGEGRSR